MFGKLSTLLSSNKSTLTDWLSPVLSATAFVTAYFTYKGASLGATTFDEHANATVFAIGSAIAIYAFWSLVFKSMLDWDTRESKRKGLTVVAVGLLFIIPLSSIYNASGIDRGQVLNHHQTLFINELSIVLEARLEANKALDGVIAESAQNKARYAQLRDDEGSVGTTSGVAGRSGAVYAALDGAAKRFGALESQLVDFQSDADKALKNALVRLERIRAIAGSSKPIGERDRLIKNEVDIFRSDFAKLDGDAMKEAAIRTIAALPGEVRLAANFSKNTDTKQAQAEALDRLSDELEDAADEFAVAFADGPSDQTDTIPEYSPKSPTNAIIAYWPQAGPQIAGGLAIDLLPAALLFLCLVSLSARPRKEVELDALLNTTSGGDLIRILALGAAVRTNTASPETEAALRDAALRSFRKD